MITTDVLLKVRSQRAPPLPPDNLVLRSERPNLPIPGLVRRINEVFAMGPGRPCPLYAWVMRRVAAYDAGPGPRWSQHEIEFVACRDYLDWRKRNP